MGSIVQENRTGIRNTFLPCGGCRTGNSNKYKWEYGLYDSIGFIFTSCKTLADVKKFCAVNKLIYKFIAQGGLSNGK